jgi:hypothetical protein
MLAGVDPRIIVGGAIVIGFMMFALVAFVVSWIRSTPAQRKRWSYRGDHDGGGGLGPPSGPWRGRHRGR